MPEELSAGEYYLVVVIDRDDSVEEFDEENNIWISAVPDIVIDRRPNLRVGNASFDSGFYAIGDELSFEVTLVNDGLGDVPYGESFHTVLYLSENDVLGDEDDIELIVYPEMLGIAAGETVTYGITASVPETVRPGVQYHLAIYADRNLAVPESDEDDNGWLSEASDLMFGAVGLKDALLISPAGATIANGAPGEWPWFGQSDETFDGISAAQSAGIGDGQISTFSISLDLAVPSTLSFFWKVSSERVEGLNGVKEDYLAVSVDAIEQQRLSGEVDWTKVSIDLPAGLSQVTWSYIKDESDSSGRDAAWVDVVRVEATASLVSLSEALDDDLYPWPFLWVDSGWSTSPGSAWFGQEDRLLADGGRSSADGVDAAQSGRIGPGETSWLEREIEVAPSGPATLKFSWKLSAAPAAGYFSFSISGVERARLVGDQDWTTVEFLVPSGPQILRWEYVKTGIDSHGEDAAFLDEVQVVSMDLPDLFVTNAAFTAGEYVLDRDRLPLEVTIRNQGAALQGINLNVSDVAVRLSTDTVWGNSDDVILGHFARVQSFDSGRRLVFSGDLSLPLDTPSGDYYLAVLVDPFEKISEWSLENNYFWSTGRDIRIRRLPDLVLRSASYDQGKIYYPLSPLQFTFDIGNTGLGAVPGGTLYNHRIELRGREIPDSEEAAEDVEGTPWIEAPLIASLADIVEDGYMPGVSAQRPEGSTLSYDAELMLPDELTILKALGIADAGATALSISAEARAELLNYEFSLLLFVDSNSDVAESDETNIYAQSGIGLFNIVPVDATRDISRWADDYQITLALEDPDELEQQLRQYAFDQNPHLPETQRTDQAGFVVVDDKEFLRISFNLVKASTDLRYTVEVSEDLNQWSPLIEFEPPFLSRHGPRSLTGVGGLTESPLVLSAADQGYSAVITVRDNTSIDEAGGARFLRVNVDLNGQ